MDSGFTIGVGLIPIAVTVVLSGIGAVVWFIRLEANVKANRSAIEELKASTNSLDNKLDKIDRNLHRIMGKLGIEPVD